MWQSTNKDSSSYCTKASCTTSKTEILPCSCPILGWPPVARNVKKIKFPVIQVLQLLSVYKICSVVSQLFNHFGLFLEFTCTSKKARGFMKCYNYCNLGYSKTLIYLFVHSTVYFIHDRLKVCVYTRKEYLTNTKYLNRQRNKIQKKSRKVHYNYNKRFWRAVTRNVTFFPPNWNWHG